MIQRSAPSVLETFIRRAVPTKGNATLIHQQTRNTMLNENAVSATPAVDSLSFIAQRINDHHGQATRHAKTAIEHARQAGELLLEAKALVNHGEWIGWLADNCAVSPRQAQRYMRVVTHWELITKNDAASHLTIDDAIKETQRTDCPVEARLHALSLIRSVNDELGQKLASTNDIGQLVEIQKQAAECQLLASRIRLDFERAAGRLLTAADRIAVEDDPTSEELWTRKLEALQPENMLVASFPQGCSFVFASATNADYFHHYSYFWLDDCEGGEAQETQRPVLLSATARALSREGFSADEFTEVERDGFAEHDIKAELPYSQDFYRQLRGSR